MKKALKYGLFLCVLGVIVGVLLSVVNAFTKPEIERQEKEKVSEMLNDYNDQYSYEDISSTITLSNGVKAVYKGTKDGLNDIYIYKTVGLGYGNGEMIVMVFISDNTILNVSIVSTSGQTKGVGSLVEEQSYLDVFKNAKVSKYAGIKSSSHTNKDADVISGATYSSRGIIEAVIKACDLYTSSEVNK